MKRIKLKLALFLSLSSAVISFAQVKYYKYLSDTSFKTLDQVHDAFEADWKAANNDTNAPSLKITADQISVEYKFNKKERRYIQYKRWEDFVAPRVYPSNQLSELGNTYENFKTYREEHPAPKPNANLRVGTTWTLAGPTGAADGGRNAGRMNFIRIDPKNNNIVYAGSPAGGLWKSTDAAATWNPISDHLTMIGCSDLAIDPTNTNNLFLLTGDNDGGDTRSAGVFKSTDGGATWAETGLKWTAAQGKFMSRILINPTNTQILMVFGADGVYRTTNGGTTWTQTLTGSGYLKDAELKPDDPNIVYAVSSRLYRSSNGGQSFTQVTSGLPTSDVGRVSMDVTPANPNYVYIFMAKGDGDTKGIYRSTDAGLNFTQRSTASVPNILGYNQDMGSGNQTGYDMGFSANKTDPEILFACGVRNWKSTDGGVNWVVATKDCQNTNLEMHWDIHYLEWLPGSTTIAYAANDGGVFKTTNGGTCWSAMNQKSISVHQIYGFGVATDNPEIMISGHQDGATFVHTNGNYNLALGGDGFQAFIDRTNSKVMYGELYFGGFCRTTDGGANWTWLADNPGLKDLDGAWNTPWCQDPTTANTLWAGYDQVLKSTDRGNNWTQVGTISGSGKMVDVKVAPSNSNVVFAARYNQLFTTTNGGGTWTNVTSNLPVNQTAITRIAIHQSNPQIAWVTLSGYSAGNKVYKTTNGGTSWTNLSTGLPNIPMNCINYVPGSATNEIYVGSDIGVYYLNDNLTTWVEYFDGLPNTVVTDIEIYSKGNEIRVSTYGRGIWKAPLYNPNSTCTTPAAPTVTPTVTYCQNVTATALTATASSGNSLKWYGTSQTGGTASAIAPTPSTSVTGTVTYYVSQAISTCESPRAAIAVKVNAQTTWYADTDGDGMGDVNTTQKACTQPTGYVATSGDACPNDANKTAAGICGCGKTEQSCTDCNNVANGTATVDNCNRCTGGTTNLTACTSIIQAENMCVHEGTVDATSTGFTGTGFVNTTNSTNVGVTFVVNASAAGNQTIGVRFANFGTGARNATIKVNGTTVAQTFTFALTGAWTTWMTEEQTIALAKGNNTIEILSSTASGLPNMDMMYFVSSNLTEANCSLITSIENENANSGTKVYPNPSHSSFMLEGKRAIRNIKAFNSKGQEVYLHEGEINGILEFGKEFSSDVYLLKIQYQDGKTENLKLVKTK